MANAAWLGLGLESVWPITYCEDHSHLMSFEFLNSLETETLTAMCWCVLVHQLGIEKINMIVQWDRDTSMISSEMTVLFLSTCIFPMCRLDHILCLDNRSKKAFWLDSMIFIGANCWMPRHAISRCQDEGRANTLFSSIVFTLQSTPANAGNIFVPICNVLLSTALSPRRIPDFTEDAEMLSWAQLLHTLEFQQNTVTEQGSTLKKI